MEIEVIGEDAFGAAAYGALFKEIMADIGKAFQMDRALLSLRPEVPLFTFSVRLRAEPTGRTVADVSNVRAEGGTVYLTITDERYAPDILRELWARFGKGGVRQLTRFDIEVDGAAEGDVGAIVVASGEEYMKEIVGAVWRSMPEGIKNRRTFIDGPVITVVATEERLEPYMLEEGMALHRRMAGVGGDV